MSKREQYYQSLPYYRSLTVWKQHIDKHNMRAAVSYWNTKGLKANDSYVQYRKDSWVPALYYCCLKAEHADMVKVLLRQGADPEQLPDSDSASLLPFVCHNLYLKTLSKMKRTAFKCNPILKRSIDGRLNVGDAKRLSQLVTLGFISPDTVKECIRGHQDIILEKLQAMIKFLTFTYNMRSQATELNLTDETTKTVAKFQNTVYFLLSYGAPLSQDTIKHCVDHYLHEIINICNAFGQVSWPQPVYHTQMDSTTVAITRPLLNDHRYVQTCISTGHKPDADVFNLKIFN